MKRTGMGLFIRIFAVILMIFSILGGLGIGIGYSRMYYDTAPYVIMGIVVGVMGFMGSLCLFAFGQMYDDVRNIRDRVYGQRPQGMPRGMNPGAMPQGQRPQQPQRPQQAQRPNPVMDMFRKPKAEDQAPAQPQEAQTYRQAAPYRPATPATPAAQPARPFEPATPATPAAQPARPFEPATPASAFKPATPATPAAPAADFEQATQFRPASPAQTVASFEEAVPFEEAPAFTPASPSVEDVRAAVDDISDAADNL